MQPGFTHVEQPARFEHEKQRPHDVLPKPVVVDAVADQSQPGTVLQKVAADDEKPIALHALHAACPGMGATLVPTEHAVCDDAPDGHWLPCAHGGGA